MEEEFRAYVAMDWADQAHQVSLQEAGATETERFAIQQKPEAIQEWVGKLRQRFGSGRIAVAVEQKRGALIYCLMKYELFVIFPLNTTAVKNYRKALRASGAKDDISDADLQLVFLKNHLSRLRRWQPESAMTRQLKFLVESRRELVDQATAVSNRITALLKEYYPTALQMVGKLNTALACDFLKRWPNLTALKRAGARRLRRFHTQHNCRSSRKIEERIELAATALPLIQEEEMIRTYSLMLEGCVDQLKVLLLSIERLEQEIQRVFSCHPDAAIYNSLPAAGAALAPRLAAALGGDRTKFDDATAILNLTGVAPITIRSGKSKVVAFRFAAPKFQRQTFIEFARVSIPYCAWAREDYKNYRAQGNNHQAAIRRIAYKWIRIIFRCWKNGIPYDEARYLAARAARKAKSGFMK
jgi:transposase